MSNGISSIEEISAVQFKNNESSKANIHEFDSDLSNSKYGAWCLAPRSDGIASDEDDLSAPAKKWRKKRNMENYSMKFPKPRFLVANDYPDLRESQPSLIKRLAQENVYPKEGTKMQKYLTQSVEFLKAQQRARAKKASQKKTKVNLAELGKNLYFVHCYISSNRTQRDTPIRALVDTGAANSLLHTSVVNRLGLNYKPIKLTLATTIGANSTAIKGIVHLKFGLITDEGKQVLCCTNFIVSSRLNGLESIIRSEFLFDSKVWRTTAYGILSCSVSYFKTP
jgi:hypothetical protein